jgi:hypothetical protein
MFVCFTVFFLLLNDFSHGIFFLNYLAKPEVRPP